MKTMKELLKELRVHVPSPITTPAHLVYTMPFASLEIGRQVPEPLGVPSNDRMTYDSEKVGTLIRDLRAYTQVAGPRPAMMQALRMVGGGGGE